MNYKNNTLYFTKENIGKLSIACWVAVAVGLLVYFALGWPWKYFGAVFALIAVVVAIVTSTMSVSDKEYTASVVNAENTFKKDFRAFTEEKLNAHNGRGKAPISLDEEKIKFARAYLLEGQVMFRVGHDGRRRSNKLVMTAFYLDKTAVYLGYRLLSMTADECEEIFAVYPYASVESISASRPEERPSFAEYDTVTLKLKNKAEPVVFHMTKDIELDHLVNHVSSHITKDEE
ncbi:MAG: hypothetical protein IJW34_02690 [Clostridia bacterium]|nr:hypothetical protein [Clostridia bacterium]